MVVSNGPGVAFPIIFIGYILKLFMILYEFKIMFIESYCRSKSISLCGKLVEPICDRFIVLWKNLETKKREYLGKILWKNFIWPLFYFKYYIIHNIFILIL